MKSTLKAVPALLLAAFMSVLMSNCQDDSYLIDGGISTPNYDGTIWEYLNSRPDYFETLVKIIEIADMVDVFDSEEITFFAPTDWSINGSVNYLSERLYRYLGEDSIYDLRQIPAEVWKEYLSMYILKGSYLLNDIPQIDTTNIASYSGQAYLSYGGRSMNAGVVYADASGVKYAGYRQIIYSYVNDFTTMDMQNAYIATCNIQPTNGVVHVIRFIDHAFGYYYTEFAAKAINAGIIPIEEIGIDKTEEEESTNSTEEE
ncbi:MAG: fasciclin domain-containing protein [Bacteroides sp.]|nr:fasciclin domain-containing protein [Bacteroides sp.]